METSSLSIYRDLHDYYYPANVPTADKSRLLLKTTFVLVLPKSLS
jgi:hypothetical protein